MVKITKKKLTCINSVHLSSNHGRKNVTDNSDDGSDYEQNDYDQPLKIKLRSMRIYQNRLSGTERSR